MMRKLRYFLCGRLFPCTLLFLVTVGVAAVLAIRLPALLAPVAAAERVFSFGVGIYLFFLPLPAERKLPSLLLLLFLPWVGAIVCLLYRPVTPRRGTVSEDSAAWAEECKAKEATYFADGQAFYPRFLRDLSEAQHSIYLEYYIIARGIFWGEILSVLEKKAKSGVDVRLIYDDFGSSLTLPRGYAKRLRKKGILSFPFRRLRFPSRGTGHRDHRKIAVIDGRIAYTGGLNLADEYVGKHIRFGHWKDTAIRITGDAAGKFALLFCQHWNAYAPKGTPPLPAPQISANGEGLPFALVADGTEGGRREGERQLTALTYRARRTAMLCTPYLAPTEGLKHALASAAESGTQVRVLIPHVPDKKAVFLVTRSYARELLRAGVQVREYTAGFLHAKTAVFDGKYAFVGSYNLDFRSLCLQAECGALVADEALCRAMHADFSAMWEDGTPVPAAGAGEKLLAGVLRLFSTLM